MKIFTQNSDPRLDSGPTYNILQFGARDGFDSTDAINEALTQWAQSPGSTLEIPDGEFIYDSVGLELDLQGVYGNSINSTGKILNGTKEGIAITISNAFDLSVKFKLSDGGVLGDFSLEEQVGGSTFLKLQAVQRGKVDITSISYEGRVLQCSSLNNVRCLDMDISMYTQGRIGAGLSRCGQPFYLTQFGATTLGAFGRVSWRGEGSVYGPIFSYMNDLVIPYIEAGEFINSGVRFEGVRVCQIELIYIGENDAGTNTDAVHIGRYGGTGLKSFDFTIDKARFLRSDNGFYITDIEKGLPFHINAVTASNCTGYAVRANNVPTLTIDSVGGKDIAGCIYSEGDDSELLMATISMSGAVTDDVVAITGDVTTAVLTGSIEGGVAGKSLIMVDQNRDVTIQNMSLDSDVCDQLVNIGFAGDNQIRHIGGEVLGASPAYNAGLPARLPRITSGVQGFQTEFSGSGTFLSGNSTVTVTNVTGNANAIVSVTPLGADLSGMYVQSIGEVDIVFGIPSAAPGDRQFRYSIDASRRLNDTY